MNRRVCVTLVVGMVILLSMLPLPVFAQEAGPFPVTGSFNYTAEVLASLEANGNTFSDATENEVWIGDFEGTAVSPFPLVAWSSGEREAWLLTTFEGTVLGEYEGTLTMIAIYTKPNGVAEWHGKWMIVSGTGDLEHLRGHGVAWGPGSSHAEEGMPHILYTGEVMFLEPMSE